MKRNKLWLLLTAFAMAFLVVGTVLAATPASDQGVVPTTHDGNITLEGGGNSDAADCDAADGIETGDTGGSETTDNGVTVEWTYDDTTKEFGFTATGGVVLKAYIKGGNGYNEYDYTGMGGVTSDGGMFAPDTNNDGVPQGLSHAVFCTGEGEEETSEPSFEASEEAETDEPSFEGSVEELTEPPTDTLPGNATATPADSAWLLVVALGVLLASIVVLTPARAKSRR
ncbi:MAG TPA: hypothetical protein VNL94_03495 [Candidatus Binatia bacterium]|nr:hypothetical protein [Candidatus Binatia bacterium]